MKSKGFQFQRPVKEFGFMKYIMAMAPDDILLEIFQVVPEKASAEMEDVLKRAFALGDSNQPQH